MQCQYEYLESCPTIPEDAELFLKSVGRFKHIKDLDPPAEMQQRINESIEQAKAYCRENRPFRSEPTMEGIRARTLVTMRSLRYAAEGL
jgi:hypothetical protein